MRGEEAFCLASVSLILQDPWLKDLPKASLVRSRDEILAWEREWHLSELQGRVAGLSNENQIPGSLVLNLLRDLPVQSDGGACSRQGWLSTSQVSVNFVPCWVMPYASE